MATTAAALATRTLTGRDPAELAALGAKLGGAETAAQWTLFLARADAVGVGALVDGRIVGYAAGAVRGGFGLPAPVAWVEAFGIDLGQRGQGIGRALLGELLERFARSGATHVYTLVAVHDPVLAPFFRQVGFRDEPLSCLGRAL